MKTSHDPYRPPQIDESRLVNGVATWRRVLGTICRVLGVVLVAIALLAIVNELFRSGFMDRSLDGAGIVIAVVVYLATGGLLIISGNKLSPGRRQFREQDDQERNV